MGTIRIQLTADGWQMWQEQKAGKGGFRVVRDTFVKKLKGEKATEDDQTFTGYKKSVGN